MNPHEESWDHRDRVYRASVNHLDLAAPWGGLGQGRGRGRGGGAGLLRKNPGGYRLFGQEVAFCPFQRWMKNKKTKP